MAWAIAFAAGPIIGGILIQKTSWRWCFLINLPCIGAAFIALLLLLHIHNPRTNLWDGLVAIDWLGTFLILGATLMLFLGLQYGSITFPWNSPIVLCLIVFAVVLYSIFAIIEWRVAKYPVLPLRVLRRSGVLPILGVVCCHGFNLVGILYFLPFYFQNALGASPLESAIWSLPLTLVISFGSIITGLTIMRTGRFQEIIIIDMGLAALGAGLFIDLGASQDWAKIILFQIIVATGLGLCFQAPLIAMQSKILPADNGVAASMFTFIRDISCAASVVIGGVIIQNHMKTYTSHFEAAGVSKAIINNLVFGTGGSKSVVDSLTSSQRELAKGAIANSLSKVWIFYMCMLILGFLFSWGIGATKLSKTHEDYKTGLDTKEKNRLANARRKSGDLVLNANEMDMEMRDIVGECRPDTEVSSFNSVINS